MDVKSKKKLDLKVIKHKDISEINMLMSESENQSDFLKKLCIYLEKKWDYTKAFILLRYNNGEAKDLFNSGQGPHINHFRDAIMKEGDLPCCKLAYKKNGVVAICDPLFTCKGCVVCKKNASLPSFSVLLKYMDKTFGALVVSVPEEHAYNQHEVFLFSKLAAEVSMTLQLFDQDGESILYQKSNMDVINEYESFIVSLKEKNRKLQFQNEELKREIQNAETVDNCKIFFLENISHEFTNSINGVLGFSQLLSTSTGFPAKLKEYVNHIDFCANRLLYTFNNICEMSRIESGRIRLNKENYSLDNLLIDLYKKYLVRIKTKKGKRVKLKFSPDKPVDIIYADKELLQKSFEHILNNAIKNTHSGEIEFGYKLTDEKSVLFFVRDTGAGIHIKNWKTIFEKFRQVEESSRKEYCGTGLGLSIAKGYIEKMGGMIWLESRMGEGSIFYFNIPSIIENDK